MEELKLKAEKREMSTKGFVHGLRRQGKIPAICYGKDNINITVDGRDFEKVFLKAGLHILIDLSISKDKSRAVLIKSYQIEPIKKNITHIDFLEVDKDKPVKAKVPIRLVGQAVGAKTGGVLEHKLHKLAIKTLAKFIPETVEVDVTKLEVGDSLYVENLSLDKNIKILAKPRQAVVAVATSRTTKMAEQEEKPEEEQENPETK
ncbi:MAG: 50S ribosomal protein L25 [bacterium]|nr:MAG: 50S ribosomal protein L25 [bacterium]